MKFETKIGRKRTSPKMKSLINPENEDNEDISFKPNDEILKTKQQVSLLDNLINLINSNKTKFAP
jgi:hypothetical protein